MQSTIIVDLRSITVDYGRLRLITVDFLMFSAVFINLSSSSVDFQALILMTYGSWIEMQHAWNFVDVNLHFP